MTTTTKYRYITFPKQGEGRVRTQFAHIPFVGVVDNLPTANANTRHRPFLQVYGVRWMVDGG